METEDDLGRTFVDYRNGLCLITALRWVGVGGLRLDDCAFVGRAMIVTLPD